MNNVIPSDQIFQLDNSNFKLTELKEQLRNKSVIVLHSKLFVEQETELLEKILSAIKVDLKKEVLCLHLNTEENLALGPLTRNLEIPLILNFGCSMKQLKLNIPEQKYMVYHFRSTRFVNSDSLEELMKNKQLKMLLWNALKTCAFK